MASAYRAALKWELPSALRESALASPSSGEAERLASESARGGVEVGVGASARGSAAAARGDGASVARA